MYSFIKLFNIIVKRLALIHFNIYIYIYINVKFRKFSVQFTLHSPPSNIFPNSYAFTGKVSESLVLLFTTHESCKGGLEHLPRTFWGTIEWRNTRARVSSDQRGVARDGAACEHSCHSLLWHRTRGWITSPVRNPRPEGTIPFFWFRIRLVSYA